MKLINRKSVSAVIQERTYTKKLYIRTIQSIEYVIYVCQSSFCVSVKELILCHNNKQDVLHQILCNLTLYTQTTRHNAAYTYTNLSQHMFAIKSLKMEFCFCYSQLEIAYKGLAHDVICSIPYPQPYCMRIVCVCVLHIPIWSDVFFFAGKLVFRVHIPLGCIL